MTSTFHGLELGKRALFAQQTALSTTGHNIANANTTGYTRQRVDMQATNPISIAGTSSFQLGTGVDVNKIERLREDYLDLQMRGENKNLGYWEAKSDTLSKVEEVLNEPSDNGLAHVMDEFWAGWEELAKNPDNASARSVVRQKGVAVAETFNYLSNSLDSIQSDLKLVIEAKTSSVNSLATQISNLNDQISRLVPNNYEPNDLYDQRDVLIDQLSKLVDVKVSQADNGMVNISVSDEMLVSGKTASQLNVEIKKDIDGNEYVSAVTIKSPTNPAKEIQLQSGELAGRIESFGTATGGIIPDMKKKVDLLAQTFAEKINQVHSSGLRISNNNGTITMVPATGINFFNGSNAKNLVVNPDIMNSLDMIAAAAKEANGSSSIGNGGNAQAIANIKFDGSLDFNGTTSTSDDFYRNIIGQLGIDSLESQRMKSNSEVIVQQVENRRLSVSGVSIDEEMANMIKYQQAYNAAARMVTAMDQCLDKVINGMGRVGL
ncbi:flagellar hook-associated protein FlgK [Neobacillus sp. MM2021_6]|uniref:flagellar hook-associated protein FlgK n=1 Tax=Bacillaceae TaxID=186817 RepID=UPI0014088361|nr:MULTISPECIES: flagellar hook-associated protein FlgK [Bacillaceae]MBO0961051.1 flagellar hook-associated protein FlgK [Neobacillus sp. MM2021_6]NHC21339.1 flagellar hook-associated protein FlgK [Bacillus sp. MM2020_4]